MESIRRNTDPLKGPQDGVAADLQCAVTQFEQPAEKGAPRTVKAQSTMPCTVYCSYTDGTVGVSIRGLDLQVDILVEELIAIMQAGAEANHALTAPLREPYTDEVLEEKWRELQTVQWDEADSPSGLILSEPWWIFPKGVDQGDLWAWFDEHHSVGIEYLHELID